MWIPHTGLTRSLITLVNDNHADNYLKEHLAFVSYGSIVNNRSNYTGTSPKSA